jgi:hypothetical protein
MSQEGKTNTNSSWKWLFPLFSTDNPSFWALLFYAPSQFTQLCNFHSLIFGLMPFGWLNTWTLPRQYKSQRLRTKLGGCTLTANYINYCAFTIYFRLHGLLTFTEVFSFHSSYKCHKDTPNPWTKNSYDHEQSRQ